MDLTLKAAPPFRLDLTAWVLRRLPINAMDHWQDRTYSRVMLAGRTYPFAIAAALLWSKLAGHYGRIKWVHFTYVLSALL